jgi:hypothetical protein
MPARDLDLESICIRSMHETPRAIRKTYQLRSTLPIFYMLPRTYRVRAALIITVRSAEKPVAESVAFAGEAD